MDKFDLLITELSSRQPYGVKVLFKRPDYNSESFKEEIGTVIYVILDRNLVSVSCGGIDYCVDAQKVKLLLKPMNAMAKEDEEAFHKTQSKNFSNDGTFSYEMTWWSYDWLNKNHFAYRTLEGKTLFQADLAIEAKEDIYK